MRRMRHVLNGLFLFSLAVGAFHGERAWGGPSFNVTVPVMPQPMIIAPRMPSMPTTIVPSVTLTLQMPSIGFPSNHYVFPSISFPQPIQPNFQGVFSNNNGAANSFQSTRSTLDNIQFPGYQVQPTFINPFGSIRLFSKRIRSNILPNGNVPGAVDYRELSAREMGRVGLFPSPSQLERSMTAGADHPERGELPELSSRGF